MSVKSTKTITKQEAVDLLVKYDKDLEIGLELLKNKTRLKYSRVNNKELGEMLDKLSDYTNFIVVENKEDLGDE